MSSTTPASAPGASAQAAARAHAMAGRKAAHGGNGIGTDQFAQMLLLLSATNDAAPDSHGQGGLLTATHGQTLGTTDNPHGTASLNGTGPGALPDAHPLAALMGWPGAPLPLSPKTQPLSGAPPEATLPGATVGAAPDLSSGGSPVTAGAPETGTARSGLAGSDSTTPAATATTGSISTASAPGTPALATPVTPTTAAAPDLSGMQRLERPAAPDEATLAALARREGGAETAARPAATPTVPGSDVAAASHANGNAAAPANTARPTTAWRSTATGVTTGSVQQQHVQNSLSERLQLRVDVAAPLALRSTVTLDERFTANTASDGLALTGAAVAGSAPSAAGTGAGAGAGGQPGTGEHAASPHETPPAEPEVDADAPFDGLLAEPEPEENMGTWNAAGLRQASLRVGEAGEDAIDIRLSMNGQELDVAFRTDSADTRAELRQNAGESLSDMLQRSGIRLGDVSVGAQNGQQPGGGQQAQTPPRNAASGDATGDAGTAAGAETPPASTASARPRSDGSRPLDLFV